jgi:pyrimidine-specific ribonucleoside hydrolase
MSERGTGWKALAAGLVIVVLGACSAPGDASRSPAIAPSIAAVAPVTMVVDTDVAGDDLVALAFLLSAPEVDIAAITVSGTGEAHCGPGVDVVLRLLERLEAPDIPVACGRETPLAGDAAFPDEWRAAVDAGSGLDLPQTDRTPFNGTAIALIGQSVAAHPELIVLTLGPMTNVGEALDLDPALAEQVGAVVVMGGALHVPGNVGNGNDVAEWNIYVDPRALQIVVDAGLAPELVSLDGTNQVPVTTEFAARVVDEATAPAALVLADLFAANDFMTNGSYYLWDPLAAMLAAGYPVGTFTPAAVAVEETPGAEWGFTRPVDTATNVDYLSEADAAAAENTLLGILNAP